MTVNGDGCAPRARGLETEAGQDLGKKRIIIYIATDRLGGKKERGEDFRHLIHFYGFSLIQLYSITSLFMTEFSSLICHLHVDFNKYNLFLQ